MGLIVNNNEEFINVNDINDKMIKDKNKYILIKLNYATTENFMGEKMYPTNNAWLRKDVAESLVKANNFLYWMSGKEYRLCLYDAGRPKDVQKKMFERIQDKNWIDDPDSSPSTHNFGLAVDVTIVDKNGNELNMGTDFTNCNKKNRFTDKSKIIYEELYIPSYSNSLDMDDFQTCMIYRRLLRRAMCEYGFLTNKNKWWHFEFVRTNYANERKLPIITSYKDDGFTLEENKYDDTGSDNAGSAGSANSDPKIIEHHLKAGQYVAKKKHKNDYIILHHTAGHNNPYNDIEGWNKTSKRIATEFIVGGQNCKTGNKSYDGVILRAFPEGSMAYHADSPNEYLNEHSVGIEICNMGYVTNDNKTYTGGDIIENQIVDLGYNFLGYNKWHKYSDEQIKAVKYLLFYISKRDNIPLNKGLYELLTANKNNPGLAFKYIYDKYVEKKLLVNGKLPKGLYTHRNVKNGKWDCSPQPNLIKMILEVGEAYTRFSE